MRRNNLMKIDEEKLHRIASHYGLEVQLTKLAEECAEYAASQHKVEVYSTMMAIGHSQKYCDAQLEEACEASAKELADVLVVAKQIELLLEDEPELKADIQRYMDEKLNRQLKRIKEEER